MKKHISLLLALCMLFTMLPMGMTVVSATTTTVTQSVADPATETEDVIEISTLQSEITLTFTPAVGDCSAITFTKEGGTAIAGAVVGTAGTVDGGSTYTLKFGRLEDNTRYTLTVPTSVTGNGAATTYTYLAEEPEYEYRNDFNGTDYVVDSAPPADYDATNKPIGVFYTPDKTIVDTQRETGAVVIADDAEDKAVALMTTGATETVMATTTTMGLATGAFSSKIDGERDVYVIDTAVKTYVEGEGTEGTAPKRVFRYGGDVNYDLAQFAAGNKLKTTNVTNSGTEIGAGSDWKKVRAVVKLTGEYGAGSTTPVKPNSLGGSGNTKIEVSALYDVTGATPIYYGENSQKNVSGNHMWIGSIAKTWQTAAKDYASINDRVAVDYVYAKKDKAMTVLKTDGYTKADKKVVFHMSDGIDATTLSTIAVTDAEGVAVEGFTTAADAANRTITVAFPAGLGTVGTESTYTIDISRVIGTNGVAVYNGVYTWDDATEGYVTDEVAKPTFTVAAADAGTMAKIDESSIARGAEDVSVHVGEATVKFTQALSDEALDGISIVSVDGDTETAIRGKVTKTLSDDGMTVTFTFGRLDAGAHKIKVDGTVVETAAGGEVATEAIAFTTVEEMRVDINTEFNGANYVVGEVAPEELYSGTSKKLLHYSSGTTADDGRRTVGTEVIADGSDDKAIALNLTADGSANATGTAMNIQTTQFSSQLTEERDVYVIDTAVKTYTLNDAAEGPGEKQTLRHFKGDGSPKYMGKFATGNVLNTQNIKDLATNVQLGAGSDWKKVRAVVRMSGKWGAGSITPVQPKSLGGSGSAQLEVSDLYDVTGATPVFYGETNSLAINNTSFKIAYIGSSWTTAANDAKSVDDRVAVDYLYARKDKAMTVLDADLGYIKADKKVVFYMTDDIDAASLGAITVTDPAGAAVEDVSATADAAMRAITVTFPNGLATAGDYTVDLSGVIGTNGVAVYNGKYYWNTEYEGTDAAGYLHENRASIDFTVEAGQESAPVTKIAESSIASGAADVSVHVGEATVKFTQALSDETLDGISIVSVDGDTETAIRGKVTKTLSDDGLTVTFTFGRLDAGAHKIKVDGTVVKTAVDGEVATEAIEFTTVEESTENKLDFTTAEGFTAGSAIPDGKGILNASANGLSVVADGDTDNAVRVQPGEGTADKYKGFNLIYNLAGSAFTSALATAAKGAYLSTGLEVTTLTDERDVYVIETALKANTPIAHTNSDIRIMNGSYNASNSSPAYPPLTSTTESAVIAYTKNLLNGSDATIPAEADGWTKVRAVLRADGRYHGKYEAGWKDTAIKAPTASSIAPVVATDVYGASSAGAKFIGTAKGGTYNAVGINIAGFTLYDNNADFKQNYIDVDYIYTKKEKAMTVFDSDLDYTKADKKIVFYMTDDIDATSKDDVVVKRGETVISDRTVTVDAAERSITITFGGLTAGDYTVDLSGVVGTNGVAVYNGVYVWDETTSTYANHENLATVSFTVPDSEGSFTIEEVKSGETVLSDTIDADASEITIAFAGNLAYGAADAITFTKEGESGIDGKLIKTQDSASVTLTFGRLEEGAKYVLTIPDTVKSEGGAAVTAKTYTLTATREYEIKHDFSGMAEDGDAKIYDNDNGWKGATSAGTIAAMTTGYNEILSTDEFGILFDGIVTAKKNGEDTYLEMKPYSSSQTSTRTGAYLVPKKANGGATTFVGKYFNSEGATYEGKDGYVLAMDARVNTQAIDPEATTMHLTSIFSIYDQAVAKFQGSGAMGTLKTFYNQITGIKTNYAFNALAENEYNSARMVLSAKTRPAVYTDVEYKLYDLDKGVYVGKEANMNTSSYGYSIYADLAVQTVSEKANPGSSNVAINLTDFGVFYAKAMYVLDTQFDAEDYVVTIAMSDEIDPATVNNLAITVDGETINPATYEVACGEERTIKVTFPYGLKAGDYTVSLAGVEAKNGLADGSAIATFNVAQDAGVYLANFTFEGSADGAEFSELVGGTAGEGQISIGDATQIKVSAEIGGAEDAAVFLAVYDEDYNLVNVVKVANNGEDVYTATLTGLEAGKVKHASMYIWESIDTLKPLFKPLQCL